MWNYFWAGACMKIPLKIKAGFVFGARRNTICQAHCVNKFPAYHSKSAWSLIVNRCATRNALVRSPVTSVRGTQLRINILYAENIGPTKRAVWYTERLIGIIWPSPNPNNGLHQTPLGPCASGLPFHGRAAGIGQWPNARTISCENFRWWKILWTMLQQIIFWNG